MHQIKAKLEVGDDHGTKIYGFDSEVKCEVCGGDLSVSGRSDVEMVHHIDGNERRVVLFYRCAEKKCARHSDNSYVPYVGDKVGAMRYGADIFAEMIYYINELKMTAELAVKNFRHHYPRAGGVPSVSTVLKWSATADSDIAASIKESNWESLDRKEIVVIMDATEPKKYVEQMLLMIESTKGVLLYAKRLFKGDAEEYAAAVSEFIGEAGRRGFTVKAFVTDGLAAQLKALEDVCPEIPHGRCLVHFFRNVEAGVKEEDVRLRNEMKRAFTSIHEMRTLRDVFLKKGSPEMRDRRFAGLLTYLYQGWRWTSSRKSDLKDGVLFHRYLKNVEMLLHDYRTTSTDGSLPWLPSVGRLELAVRGIIERYKDAVDEIAWSVRVIGSIKETIYSRESGKSEVVGKVVSAVDAAMRVHSRIGKVAAVRRALKKLRSGITDDKLHLFDLYDDLDVPLEQNAVERAVRSFYYSIVKRTGTKNAAEFFIARGEDLIFVHTPRKSMESRDIMNILVGRDGGPYRNARKTDTLKPFRFSPESFNSKRTISKFLKLKEEICGCV